MPLSSAFLLFLIWIVSTTASEYSPHITTLQARNSLSVSSLSVWGISTATRCHLKHSGKTETLERVDLTPVFLHAGALQGNQALSTLCMGLSTSLNFPCFFSSRTTQKTLTSDYHYIFFKGRKIVSVRVKWSRYVSEKAAKCRPVAHTGGQMLELKKQLDPQCFRISFQLFVVVLTTTHAWFLWKAANTHKNICFTKTWFPANIFLTANFRSVPDTIICKWHQNCGFYLKQQRNKQKSFPILNHKMLLDV